MTIPLLTYALSWERQCEHTSLVEQIHHIDIIFLVTFVANVAMPATGISIRILIWIYGARSPSNYLQGLPKYSTTIEIKEFAELDIRPLRYSYLITVRKQGCFK